MLDRTHDLNFIHVGANREEVKNLFGPYEVGDYFVMIDDETTLEVLVSRYLGKFPSLSQARKNGWSGAIPSGYREWKIGKTKFWTYIPFDEKGKKEPRFWRDWTLRSEKFCCEGKNPYHKEIVEQQFQYGDAVILSTIVPVYICSDCKDAFTDDEGENLRQKAVDNFKNSDAVRQTNLSS